MIITSNHYTWFRSWIQVALLPIVFFLSSCAKENLEPYVYPQKSVAIKELILDCQLSKLPVLANFWTERMELQQVASSSGSFSVMAGNTKLTFRRDQLGYGGLYHFTIDVPENQIENARIWLQKRAKLVKDADTGAEIVHKSKLNAHSLFFMDPGGNLIELVARHDVKNAQAGDFNKSMLLAITDVSIVTRNVKDCEDLLYTNFGLLGFPGTSNSVKPIGGQKGTITLHVPSRPYYPTNELIAFSYRLEVVIQHPEEQVFKLPGCEATLRSEP
jgi:hypothetical protein